MHRVVEFHFKPKSKNQWMIHGSARAEAARLWNRLVRIHGFCRKRHWPWPTRNQFEAWSKGKFPRLHSQSVQHIIIEFLEAVNSARQLRAKGNAEARYPWKLRRYRDVTFTNQAPRFVGGNMILPCGRIDGKRAYLSVPLPKGFAYPGKLCELRLEFGKVAMVFEIADAVTATSETILGIDPQWCRRDRYRPQHHCSRIWRQRHIRAILSHRRTALERD